MKPPGEKALTVTEVMVFVVLLVFAFAMCLPFLVNPSLKKGQMSQTLSNMKQLHLATQQMALDRTTAGETNLGWPGDIGGAFSNWTAQIVKEHYLSTRDLSKLLSAPGIVLSPEKIPSFNTTAIRVYTVKEDSRSETVILSTANFTNTPTGGLPPLADAKPYGTNGFIVFRKAGDGMILKPKQAGNTNLIGGFVPLLK